MADPVVVTEYQEILEVAESQAALEVAEATTVLSVSENGEPVVVSESVESITVQETVPGEVVHVVEEPVVVQEMGIGTQGPQGVGGANWKGAYSSAAEYVPGDIVREGGVLYICTNPCQGVAVTNSGYWDIFLNTTGSGDLYFHFQQVSPSAEWTILHSLGKFPSVMVVDSAGTVVEGAVEYVDADSLKVHFASAFGGDAYLN